MKRFVLLAIFCQALFLFSGVAQAFRLSPASLEIEIKRGESKTVVLLVSTTHEKFFAIEATGFELKKDGSKLFREASDKYSGAKHFVIKTETQEFELEPGFRVLINIAVPKSVEPGEYFMTLFVKGADRPIAKIDKMLQELKAGKKPTELFVTTLSRLGCIITITVPGRTVRKKAEISEVKILMPKGDEDQLIKVLATLKNNCQVHLDARGETRVMNTKKKVFDKIVLEGLGKPIPGEAFVFPEGERGFWGVIKKPLPPGWYVAEVSFTYGYKFRKLRAKTEFLVTEELGKQQKTSLLLVVEPSLLELEMLPGSFRTAEIQAQNLGFEELNAQVVSYQDWLQAKPSHLVMRPGQKKSVRIMVTVPADDLVSRIGKVIFIPDKGKAVEVDVVIREPQKKKEGEKDEK